MFRRALISRPVAPLMTMSRRNIDVKTFFTEETVPGSDRTPNTNLSVLPLYVDGKKYDTRIAGVEVVPNAREILLALYEKTQTKCDEYGLDTYYNEFVKQQTGFRKQIVEANEDHYKIEDLIACGQIEELIEQAQDNLEALFHYNEITLKSEGQHCELGESEDDLSDAEDPIYGIQGQLFTPENIQEVPPYLSLYILHMPVFYNNFIFIYMLFISIFAICLYIFRFTIALNTQPQKNWLSLLPSVKR